MTHHNAGFLGRITPAWRYSLYVWLVAYAVVKFQQIFASDLVAILLSKRTRDHLLEKLSAIADRLEAGEFSQALKDFNDKKMLPVQKFSSKIAEFGLLFLALQKIRQGGFINLLAATFVATAKVIGGLHFLPYLREYQAAVAAVGKDSGNSRNFQSMVKTALTTPIKPREQALVSDRQLSLQIPSSDECGSRAELLQADEGRGSARTPSNSHPSASAAIGAGHLKLYPLLGIIETPSRTTYLPSGRTARLSHSSGPSLSLDSTDPRSVLNFASSAPSSPVLTAALPSLQERGSALTSGAATKSFSPSP